MPASARLVVERKPRSLRKPEKHLQAVAAWARGFRRVDVFFDDAYFQRFEKRDSEHQSWTMLPAGRSLAGELGLRVPGALRERGYRQCMSEGDGADVFENEVWIIGEEP
jgi:hypothetical protein